MKITQDVVTGWQRILIFLDEKKLLSEQEAYLKLHYKINGEWSFFFDFYNENKSKHYTDLIFLLQQKFKLSENYCNCEGQNRSELYYNANGICRKCDLRINPNN